MLPTGEFEEYPLFGLCGCTQMLVCVGNGTQVLVLVDLLVVSVDLEVVLVLLRGQV